MAINIWKFDKDLLNNNKDGSRTGLILPILTHQGEITLFRVMWPVPISQRRKFTSWPLISESLKKICSITTKMNPGQKNGQTDRRTDGQTDGRTDRRTSLRMDPCWVLPLSKNVSSTQQGQKNFLLGMTEWMQSIVPHTQQGYPRQPGQTDRQTDRQPNSSIPPQTLFWGV